MRALLAGAVVSVALSTALPTYGQNYDTGLAAYERGDYATALREIMPLAIEGDTLSQVSIGGFYMQGRGVPQDFAEAEKWFRLAAMKGHAIAQAALGSFYYSGLSVKKSFPEAAKWYQLAAEQGNTPAQLGFGLMYARGEGVLQDNVLSYMWLNIAAAQDKYDAAKNRDIIAGKMTPADISSAQRLASECLAHNYKNCGR